jgi:hypothetical protein
MSKSKQSASGIPTQRLLENYEQWIAEVGGHFRLRPLAGDPTEPINTDGPIPAAPSLASVLKRKSKRDEG